MIIDINTYIGHWPFRKIRYNSAKTLSKHLVNKGIDLACVSSLNAVFYKDTQQGNIELYEEIKSYKNKFIPFAIINPSYAGWKKDFIYCIEKLKMKGLELYPYYHDYKLTDKNSIELINLATAMNIPIHLPCAIENIRQKHWIDTNKNLSIEEVSKVITLCEKAKFIISNGSSHTIAEYLNKTSKIKNGNVFFDFARVEIFNNDLYKLIDTVSVDNIVFGSVSPFQYIEPQLVKLQYLTIEKIDKIKENNIKALLNI